MANGLWSGIHNSYTPTPQAPVGAAGLGVPSGGASYSPGTGPNGVNEGQLDPNNRARNIEAGIPYQLVPAYPPFVRLANDPRIVYFPRFRTLVFGGNGQAAQNFPVQTYLFSVPTIILARTGAAIDASAAALPVGRNSLDTFKVQFFRGGAAQDLIDAGSGQVGATVLTLGSALLGTAAQPALIQGNGLFADNGMFLSVNCQSLIANIEVHISIWCLEEFGPSRG